MKKNTIIILSILLILFTALTCAVKFYANITSTDIIIEKTIQNTLSFIPLKYPVFADKIGYTIMITIGLLFGSLYFSINKKWKQIPLFLAVPLIAFLTNRIIIKNFIHRPRPDMDLQISWIHPDSFSYVSTHTFITFCIFGIIAYYLDKNCKNNIIKYIGIAVAIFWTILTGLSRIWIGVHYPSDILGACILGFVVVILYVELSKFIERI